MEVFPEQPDEHDLFDHKGRLVERTEVFALPTIEPERGAPQRAARYTAPLG